MILKPSRSGQHHNSATCNNLQSNPKNTLHQTLKKWRVIHFSKAEIHQYALDYILSNSLIVFHNSESKSFEPFQTKNIPEFVQQIAHMLTCISFEKNPNGEFINLVMSWPQNICPRIAKNWVDQTFLRELISHFPLILLVIWTQIGSLKMMWWWRRIRTFSCWTRG